MDKSINQVEIVQLPVESVEILDEIVAKNPGMKRQDVIREILNKELKFSPNRLVQVDIGTMFRLEQISAVYANQSISNIISGLVNQEYRRLNLDNSLSGKIYENIQTLKAIQSQLSNISSMMEKDGANDTFVKHNCKLLEEFVDNGIKNLNEYLDKYGENRELAKAK